MIADLDSVACHEALVRLLNLQYARADVSLRELQARADKAGGARLPRATCADMLAGRRFPKKAVMMAFLQACRVPADQLPAWERAWERVRVTRMPAASDETGGADEAPSDPGPTRVRNRGLRRAAASAALILVAATAPLGVLFGRHQATPRAHPADPGHILSDDGRGFGRGGSSRFTATVDPANTGVRLVRRLDAGVAMQYATVSVNGRPAAIWRPLPGDDTYKWRDQVVLLPRALTQGRSSLTIANVFMSSALGFNEFHYLVEQRIDGGWTTADRVDIGPDHTADEAAHDYHIVGQGWAGTQTFAYPPDERDWRVE